MLKCLVLVALACCMQSGEAASENDIVAQFPSSTEQDQNAKPLVIMEGRDNFQAEEQIFFMYEMDPLEGPPAMSACCTNVSNIKDDYIYTPGIGAHKLHVLGSNWNAARKTCIQEGGHLAIINSVAEHDTLLKGIKRLTLIGAWVGFHDFYEEGDWTTIFDQSLESTGYAKWSPQWLNMSHGADQKCGLLVFEGGFDHGPCMMGLSFICEIPICTEEISEKN